MTDYLDNWPSPINNGTMKYSDSYMRAMAAGEITSLLVSVMVSVLIWAVLPTNSALLLIPASVVGFAVSAKTLLAFVHWGYKPEKKSTEEVL